MIYQDVLLKTNFYKEYIIKNLIKGGNKINSDVIQSKLKEIDMYLSIYEQSDVVSNTNFDVKKFNQDMYYVYKDLEILYKILYETSISEWNDLTSFATSYTNDLLTRANACKTEVDVKTSITAIGKTLSVVTNKILTEALKTSGVYVLNLGTITATAGEEIACVIDGTNLDLSTIVFKLKDSDGNITTCSPYSLNKDTVSISGSKNITAYTATQNTDEISTGKVLMSVKDFVPNDSYSYNIFAGENKIKFNNAQTSVIEYLSYTNASDSLITGKGNCSFYICNNNTDKKTTFYSSKAFYWNNFTADNLSQKEFVSFDCDLSTIINFSTNGRIFSEKQIGIVSGSSLYYPEKTDLTDFYIIETKPGDNKSYEVVIEITPSNNTQTVKYAAIKELK